MNTPETTKEAMLSLEVTRLRNRCEQYEADITKLRDYRRFQAACSAMQGLLPHERDPEPKIFAAMAVELADALLKELEK